LCEPLAVLGAEVVGTDPADRAIEVAIRHARQCGVDIDYRATTAETLRKDGETFVVVLAMEVIEHVPDRDQFLRLCADLVRPHGLVILSTLNRTTKSYWQAIVIGEYILRFFRRERTNGSGSFYQKKWKRPWRPRGSARSISAA